MSAARYFSYQRITWEEFTQRGTEEAFWSKMRLALLGGIDERLKALALAERLFARDPTLTDDELIEASKAVVSIPELATPTSASPSTAEGSAPKEDEIPSQSSAAQADARGKNG